MKVKPRHLKTFATLALLAFAEPAYASDCPPKAPTVAGSRVTVVYDPVDSSMKACVAGTWLTMSGGGGGGGNLDGLTDVVITTPTANQALVYNGAAWVNAALSLTESDPKVGALTGSKWCAANAGGIAIVCNQDAPTAGASSSGAVGYVQISDGAGGFTTSGATAGQQLFWDNTNKRLGIGTSAPNTLLDINGSATGAAFRVRGGAVGYTSQLTEVNQFGALAITLNNEPNNGGVAVSLPGDTWGRVSLGLNSGVPYFGFGSGTSGRDVFAYRSAARTFTIAGSTDGAQSGHLNVLGNVGIGTTSPGSTLDVKGTIRLSGATSGYVGFAPAAVAGSITYTLPSADGSSGQVLSTNGSGTLLWATPPGLSGTSYFWAAASHVSYSAANGSCPSGSRAIQVPQSRFGQTGTQICSGDTASDGARTVCDSVRYWYITVQGTSAAYSPNNIPCSSSVSYAWPWAVQGNSPNSRPDEWQNGTYVVCCRL